MTTSHRRLVAVAVMAVIAASGVVVASPADAGETGSGRIRGTVTADDTGLPLADVCVEFYRAPPADVVPSASAVRTGPDGKYDAVVPAGSHLVVIEAGFFCEPRLESHVGELYDDVTDIFEATPVQVPAGQVRGRIDLALATPSHITGRVTADEGGAPLEGICVYPRTDSGFDWGGDATTDADGRYDIGGLSAGGFEVGFRDCTAPIDHVSETYDDQVNHQLANRVGVGVASTAGDIDASLAVGGHVGGTVTDDVTGQPVADAYVSARRRGPPGPPER